MNNLDPTAAECLHLLLEDQAATLRSLLGRLAAAVNSGLHVVPPEEWTGPARDAHDGLVRRMTAQIDAARNAIELAASESSRAATTVAGRV